MDVETRFLVPIHEDKQVGNGSLHPPFRWEWLQTYLYDHFDGYTLALGLYRGVWRSPSGKKVSDLSRTYIVAIDTERVDELKVFLREVAQEFRQQSLYFSVAGEVEFIEGIPYQGEM